MPRENPFLKGAKMEELKSRESKKLINTNKLLSLIKQEELSDFEHLLEF
jgi:hypothetical protein